MKKLALISSYCDTNEKIKVLKNNLCKLKELNIDTLLFTPLILPKEILELADHIILSKENPILKAPERVSMNWIWSEYKGHHITNMILSEDYGWASLNQIKRLSQYALNLDYHVFYSVIYDLNITPQIEELLINPKVNRLFPNQHANTDSYFKIGASLSIFNKDLLNLISSTFKKTSYLNYPTAEDYLEALNINVFNCEISDIVTEDLIYNDKDVSKWHDMSFSPNLKVFVNNYKYLGINFYDVESPTEIKIKVNSNFYTKSINSHTIYLSDIPIDEVDSLFITIDGIEKDYSNVLPNNINTRFEIKINDNSSLEYIKDFVYSHNINFC